MSTKDTNPLKKWWNAATPEAKRELAGAVGTTYGALHQMAGAYRTAGRVSLSPAMAAKIEHGTSGEIKREDLCTACRRCDLARVARDAQS